MKTPDARSPQAGSFLLEALIAVLIIAFGILGLVGMLARSMQNVDDSKFRGEAAFLANSLISQMWISDKTTLSAHFDSTVGSGAEYVEFKTLVAQRLPNAAAPDVLVSAGPTATSTNVQVTVKWRPPGESVDHQHQAMATIGAN